MYLVSLVCLIGKKRRVSCGIRCALIWEYLTRSNSSEHELQRQLHDSRIRRGLDLSEACIAQREDGNPRVQMIRYVERLHAELNRLIFSNSKFSCQAHIDPDASGTENI